MPVWYGVRRDGRWVCVSFRAWNMCCVRVRARSFVCVFVWSFLNQPIMGCHHTLVAAHDWLVLAAHGAHGITLYENSGTSLPKLSPNVDWGLKGLGQVRVLFACCSTINGRILHLGYISRLDDKYCCYSSTRKY